MRRLDVVEMEVEVLAAPLCLLTTVEGDEIMLAGSSKVRERILLLTVPPGVFTMIEPLISSRKSCLGR